MHKKVDIIIQSTLHSVNVHSVNVRIQWTALSATNRRRARKNVLKSRAFSERSHLVNENSGYGARSLNAILTVAGNEEMHRKLLHSRQLFSLNLYILTFYMRRSDKFATASKHSCDCRRVPHKWGAHWFSKGLAWTFERRIAFLNIQHSQNSAQNRRCPIVKIRSSSLSRVLRRNVISLEFYTHSKSKRYHNITQFRHVKVFKCIASNSFLSDRTRFDYLKSLLLCTCDRWTTSNNAWGAINHHNAIVHRVGASVEVEERAEENITSRLVITMTAAMFLVLSSRSH